MLVRPKHAGVTLIELMIGLAIFAFLLSLAAPSYQLWIQNTQIRTAAESIQNALHLARVEAISRNAPVQLQLTNASGLVEWNVGCVTPQAQDCPAIIQSRSSAESTNNVRIGVGTTATAFGAPITSAAVTNIGFSALGRLTTPLAAGVSLRIDFRHPTMTNTRRLVVLVSSGGRIRLCDPALVLANNAQGCA